MLDLKEQYIVDSAGRRLAAVIPIEEFERLQGLLAGRDPALPAENDCDDVTAAIAAGLADVQAGATVPLAELLSALRG